MTTPDTAKAAEIVEKLRGKRRKLVTRNGLHGTIEELRNPDGPEAADLIEALSQRPTDTARAGEVDGWTWPHAFIRSLERVVEGGNPGHMSIYPSEARYALHAFSALKATPSPVTDETALSGELEKLRHKFWMVISHASGGALCEATDVDRSLNDISVTISQHHNRVFEGGKEAALASTPQPAVAEAALRVTFAQIIDPTAWKNEGGYMVEQVHSDDALAKADLILAAIRQGQNEAGR